MLLFCTQETLNGNSASVVVSPTDPRLSDVAAVSSSSSPTFGHPLPSTSSSFQAGPSSSSCIQPAASKKQTKSSKKGKAKMFILPEHKDKMTRALTTVGEIYGIYYGKEKSLKDLEEIYKRHRKLIKNCYLAWFGWNFCAPPFQNLSLRFYPPRFLFSMFLYFALCLITNELQ